MAMFLFYNKEVHEKFFVEAESIDESIKIAKAYLPGSKGGYGAFPKSYVESSGYDIIRKGA